MKNILCFLLVALPLFVNAQKTKKIMESKEVGYYHYFEKYHIIKDSETPIKHGVYEQWRDYGVMLKEGRYDHGKKVGLWKYYDLKGELNIKYDYDKNVLVYSKVLEKINFKPYYMEEKNNEGILVTTNKLITQPCLYQGGMKAFYEEIMIYAASDQYLDMIHKQEVNVATVHFKIGVDGKAFDFKIPESQGQVIDAAAINALKSLNYDWFPPIVDGKPTEIDYQIPFTYINDRLEF